MIIDGINLAGTASPDNLYECSGTVIASGSPLVGRYVVLVDLLNMTIVATTVSSDTGVFLFRGLQNIPNLIVLAIDNVGSLNAAVFADITMDEMT